MDLREMANIAEARKRSVDNLQRLYAFVVGLAVTESLRRVLAGLGPNGQLPDLDKVLMVWSLMLTIVPFYHGSNRYLDYTYVTGERSGARSSLMFDFIMTFCEGLFFFVLALLTFDENLFYFVLAGLLVFDAFWASTTNLAAPRANWRESSIPNVNRWAIMNLACAIVLAVVVWSGNLVGQGWSAVISKSILLSATVMVRTVLDYKLLWSFYYPKDIP